MKKSWLIKAIVCSLLFQVALLPLMSQTIRDTVVTGKSIKILDNRKDIYHRKNKDKRHELIKEAVADAIDKGASINITSVIEHVEQSSVEMSFEEYVDDFVASSREIKNVKWQRISDYKFVLEDRKLKKWRCEVTGRVIDVKGNLMPNQSSSDKKKNKYYVTRKSFNIVYLTAGTEDDVAIGDKFLVYKNKEKKARGGNIRKRKVVGYVTVTDVAEKYSEGRILKGIYSVRESHLAKKYNFKKFRSGLEYQLAGSYEQVNTTEFGETESTVNSSTHSIFYYYSSYISRMGFKLGLEMMDIKKTYPETEFNPYETDSSAYVFNPKFNLNYSIGLIPDILFVVPNASIGYLFFENGKQWINRTKLTP